MGGFELYEQGQAPTEPVEPTKVVDQQARNKSLPPSIEPLQVEQPAPQPETPPTSIDPRDPTATERSDLRASIERFKLRKGKIVEASNAHLEERRTAARRRLMPHYQAYNKVAKDLKSQLDEAHKFASEAIEAIEQSVGPQAVPLKMDQAYETLARFRGTLDIVDAAVFRAQKGMRLDEFDHPQWQIDMMVNGLIADIQMYNGMPPIITRCVKTIKRELDKIAERKAAKDWPLEERVFIERGETNTKPDVIANWKLFK